MEAATNTIMSLGLALNQLKAHGGLPIVRGLSPQEAARKILNTIEKTQFPNADPDFFKSPRLVARDKEFVDKPFHNHVWVYAAVNAIASNLLGLPKALDIVATEETELLEDHPILDLLENPNPLMSGPVFWETIILNLLLPTGTTNGGQCFIVAESGTIRPANLRRGDIPAELYPFSDAFFSPITDDKNMLVGWKFKHGKNEIHYGLEEVIRIHFTDPTNPLKGLSPLVAAMRSMRQDLKAQRVNESFFNNNATLGGVLTADGEISKETADQILKQWKEKHGGPDNAGDIAVLHSGLKYEQFMRSHQDMQFIDQRKFSRDEILAVFKVPKAEVSVYEDINFATARQADRSFWQKTLIPHDRRILGSINDQWIKWVEGGRYVLVSDLSKVEALQENFEDKLKQAKELHAMHVPVAEINRRLSLNLEIKDYPWLETALINFSLAPAEAVLASSTEEEPDPETEEEEEVTAEQLLDKIEEESNKSITGVIERAKFQDNYFRKVRLPQENKFIKKLRGFWSGQRKRNIALVTAWENKNKSINKADAPKEIAASQFILKAADENSKIQKSLIGRYRESIEKEAAQVETEIGEFVNWNSDLPGIKKAVRRRMKSLNSINNLTFKKVLREVKQGIQKATEDQLTVPQTAKLLREKVDGIFDGMTRGRAKVIARTETGIIHSDTRFSIMKEEKIERIEWSTANDELVRGEGAEFPHDILNGQSVKLGEPFNNGEDIMYPQDQGASAGNIINCRCVAIKSTKKDE